MGQYFVPVLGKNRIEKESDILGFFYTHDYDCGLKLMEHSWINNRMMNAVTYFLENNGPCHIVWTGDYADETFKLNDYDITLHDLCFKKKESLKISSSAPEDYTLPRYLVNYDKNKFVDLEKCPKDNDEWQVHPLPVLTADSNGRGSGDYSDKNNPLVGSWYNDLIGFEREKPENLEEIQPNFTDE